MAKRTSLERLRAAASRYLAVIEHYELRPKMRREWFLEERALDLLDDAHERLTTALKEAEEAA